MKFSLKQLILVVTIAGLLCGVTGYAYNRAQIAHQHALRMQAEAEEQLQSTRAALEQALIIHKSTVSELDDAKQQLAENSGVSNAGQDFKYSVLHWNVEGGGNDPVTNVEQLIKLGHYDIIGLSEVADPLFYTIAIIDKWPGDYLYYPGQTGGNDRRMLFFDSSKFEPVEAATFKGDVALNYGNNLAPIYVRLKDKSNGQEFIVILNHMAQGDAEFRDQHACALREWARTKSVPIIAIGNYNFDYNFETQKGNSGFDALLKDDVWKWIQPEEMIDTHWSDDGKGSDRRPDSMLDFNFVAGAAKDWKSECRVIVRDGDFPDDENSSDHRPVELILTK